ncbi:hypothetical protein [Alkalibacterium kapii]|uniref:SAP domain-containing protein n=1 Tax=Alkalibacterium kapii TaxID=426704 RepID=A0A511AXU5_9LACT|nr:hypothetical protein [Alkalibacterium kapii]GEK92143.1 hypothetical protein AKA01nite_17650 [Alkalibacterium kapii]
MKNILLANNLDFHGEKNQLIKRILEDINTNELSRLFTDRTYELTDLGKEVIEKEKHIAYIHRNNIEGLDIWFLNEQVQKHPGYYYKNIVWEYLHNQSLKCYKKSDLEMYRNYRLAMAKFLEEDGSDTALSYYVEVARLDLSGLSNGFSMKYLEKYVDNYFPYSRSSAKISKEVLEKIKKHKLENVLSDEELKNRVYNLKGRLNLPFSLFTVEQVAEIIIMEIHGDTKGLDQLYAEVRNNFNFETSG